MFFFFFYLVFVFAFVVSLGSLVDCFGVSYWGVVYIVCLIICFVLFLCGVFWCVCLFLFLVLLGFVFAVCVYVHNEFVLGHVCGRKFLISRRVGFVVIVVVVVVV